MKHLFFILTLLITLPVWGKELRCDSINSPTIDKRLLGRADEIILRAIDDKTIPGAVLAVVHQNKTIYLKAYGNKQVYPDTIPMEVNTIFDLASLTKPIATATSIMILTERGRIRLEDPISMYIPEFKDNIKIIHLLTHTSGLPPYAPVDSLKAIETPDVLLRYMASIKRNAEPGKKFGYSCLNYVLLQHIVEQVSGESLRNFAKKNIFDVLGMKNTDYCPTETQFKQIAPTEKQADNSVLLGIVHDPLARFLKDGVSGNAGLFSNAKDLALFAAMMLNQGRLYWKEVLSPLTVKAMRTIPKGFVEFGRTLGWDMYSVYASNQGDLFGPHTYGHTGYTGTSLIIDPDNEIAVILLTNRVHPDDKGSVVRLRALVANAVAGATKSY